MSVPWKEKIYILALYNKTDEGKEVEPVVWHSHQDYDEQIAWRMASLKVLASVFGETTPYFEVLQYFVEEYKKNIETQPTILPA